MEYKKEVLQEAKMDCWTAALLTIVAGVGTLLLLRRVVSSHPEAKEKIQRARNRRTESLRRAEEAVIRYKQSHQTIDLAPILELPLSQLTKQLHEGSLDPKDVFYSYMEKTLAVHKKLNCCTEILLESLDQLETVGSNKEGLLYGVPVSIKDNCGYKVFVLMECGDWRRGSAGGGAVCRPAVAGGALSALHEGGGTTGQTEQKRGGCLKVC
uniref:Fatty acid amide hydrolase n=1 Tax=Amphiprion percula TaxID=161767 RepID=A0A3P8S276_AMPPE